jgi:hypothetical protein
MNATGEFEVKLTPQPSSVEGSPIARLLLDKTFRGELEGSSIGEMLSVGDPRSSAAYVALERVTGTLGSRSGAFALQHTGVIDRGASSLIITIVPGSGSGGLEGIAGRLTIDISGGSHAYTLEYELP